MEVEKTAGAVRLQAASLKYAMHHETGNAAGRGALPNAPVLSDGLL
jgi:hypothetical protein